jgi:fructokinase
MVSCVIGEVLWDVFPDGERFGGAALNFCANLQRLGDQATLLSAVGDDPHGRLALKQMQTLGIGTRGIHTVKSLPTGIARVSMNEHGEPTFVIPRPAAFDEVSVDSAMMATLQASAVDWIYFGTLLQTNAATEQITIYLKEQLHPASCFYDINLRTGHWNLALVQRLSRLASIVKLNEVEAETLFSLTSSKEETFSLESFCDRWASAYGIDVICVTLGPAGCMVYDRGSYHRVPGYNVTVCDTVGSGDAFAAAFLHGYNRGWKIHKAAQFANALGAVVASRAGATPFWTTEEVKAMIGERYADDLAWERRVRGGFNKLG